MEYGIIFDLDGTLIDTERFAKECWDKALNDFKLNIPSDFREHLISVDMKFVELEMKRVLPEEITYELFQKSVDSYFYAMLSQKGLPLKRGATELLRVLKEEKVPLALATTSTRHKLRCYNQLFPICSFFNVVVCGDMIDFGKPDPQIYIRAAELLEVDIQACYIVEDSPNGIRGASAAKGMVVGIPDMIKLSGETEKMCDFIFDNLEEFRKYLNI